MHALPRPANIMQAAAEARRSRLPRVTVTTKVSLHARPAALIAARARQLSVPVFLEREGSRAPAASLFAILSLEALAGSPVTVTAQGKGAAQAVAEIAAMIEQGPP